MCKKCLKMRILFAVGGFVVGAAVGAGTTALICRKKMKEQDEMIRDLLDEINTPINKKWDNEISESKKDVAIGESIVAGLRAGIGPVDDAHEGSVAEMEQVILREGYGRIVPDQKPTLQELAQMAEAEEDPVVDIETTANNEEGEEPHEISAEEFFEDSSFDKDQLTFYADDETLCDSDDDPLDIDSYLGYNLFMEAVSKAMHGRKKTRIIYWRNPDISCDFEIELHDGSYTQTVLGIDDAEHGGYQRTNKRKMREGEDEE